ncbi:MAG: SDR family NAD(P)-dependent oxidoreductase [Oceanipulchritudo sp.]
MGRLEDKVALTTGAPDGIGHEVSRAFAAEGARVAILARGEEKLTAASAWLNREGGSQCNPVKLT